METKYNRLRWACYLASLSSAFIINISPLLFLTFHELYDISYSLLGLLILINFCTQLVVDLAFSFFSHKFNISVSVKAIPVIAFCGMLVYGILPYLFPDFVYGCLVIGTVIFSVSGGLVEVLLSPVIAKIPSDNPARQMSLLHSIYAWGVIAVVVFSAVFLTFFDKNMWQIFVLLLTVAPLFSMILFKGTQIPQLDSPEKTSGAVSLLKNKGLLFCVVTIFLSGAADCTMSQWCSGYVEQVFGLPKVLGDLLGMALFFLMLGLARTLYGRYGKNIEKTLFISSIGTTICYFVTAVSPFAVVGLLSCALTGFFVAMLWPGVLMVASERFPKGGVFVFALMAAGGDLGASVVPQLVGVITDFVAANPNFVSVANNFGMLPEQMGMKIAMAFASLFPLMSIPFFYKILKDSKKRPA